MNPPTAVTGVAGAAQTVMDVAAITVQMRIPEFWTDLPKTWFAQFEAIMAPQKQGDTQKFDMVIAKLTREALRQVTDLIEAPPETGKYETLKKRLLTTYQESTEKQFQRLVSDMDLGTQTPSQLLRKMAALAKNCNLTEEPLRKLWLSRLPAGVRAILTVSGDTKLEDLVAMADKILENMGSGEVASVTTNSSGDVNTELVNHLKTLTVEMKELRGEVNEIKRRDRSPAGSYRGRPWQQGRFRSRSRSASRRTPDSPDWICRHHYRYRGNARACEPPCNWPKEQRNTGN